MSAGATAPHRPSLADTEKDVDPQSTYFDRAFHAFLARRPETMKGLGFYAVPHIGAYGDEYTVNLPLVLVSVPTARATLPAGVLAALREYGLDPAAHPEDGDCIDVFFAVHGAAPRVPSCKLMSTNDDEVNVMFHAWAYPHQPIFEVDELVSRVPMGLFDAHGIRPIYVELEDGGIPFDELLIRSVVIHGGGRFSPENAQFQLKHDRALCSFFSVALILDDDVMGGDARLPDFTPTHAVSDEEARRRSHSGSGLGLGLGLPHSGSTGHLAGGAGGGSGGGSGFFGGSGATEVGGVSATGMGRPGKPRAVVCLHWLPYDEASEKRLTDRLTADVRTVRDLWTKVVAPETDAEARRKAADLLRAVAEE